MIILRRNIGWSQSMSRFRKERGDEWAYSSYQEQPNGAKL